MKKSSSSPAVAKKDLEKAKRSLARQIKEIKTQNSKLWVETSSIRRESKKSASQLKNSMLKFKDEILGEIKAMREELKVTLGQYKRHEETLEDHDKRIKLWRTQNSPSQNPNPIRQVLIPRRRWSVISE